MKAVISLVIIFLLSGIHPVYSKSKALPSELIVFFSGNVAGETEPCG